MKPNDADVASWPRDVLVPRYLVHCFVYYNLGTSLIPDAQFDLLARRLYAEWDNVRHPHKTLIERDALLSTGAYIQHNRRVEYAAYQLLKDAREQDEYSMSGTKSRNKGKRGEREVIGHLQPIVDQVYQHLQLEPPLLQRNTLQSDVGGFDIVGLEWMAPEVKLCQQLSLETFWAQTVEQAGEGQEPVLFYRSNRAPWRVRMEVGFAWEWGEETVVADLSLPDFLKWFRNECFAQAQQWMQEVGDE